jgi:type II secretory pathway component GspD/PulD (secretin)
MKYRLVLACCLLVWMASVGTGPALCAPATGSAVPDPSKTTVSLDLKATPLRQALATLFESTGFQHAVAPDVPNPPITMKVHEIPFPEALRSMLRSINASGIPVTYTREGDIYLIRLRRDESPSEPAVGFGPFGGAGFSPVGGATSVMEKLQIQFLHPEEVVDLLKQPRTPGIHSLQYLARDNSLLVRGEPQAIEALKSMVRLIDVAPRSLSLSAGISGPGLNGAPLAVRSMARTLVGDTVMIDEQAATGGIPARLKVTLKTQLTGDGQLQVTSDWDVSVPIAGGPRGPIRLVKRLSTTTLLRPGEPFSVAEVDLSGWGGKGVLRLWLQGQWGRRAVTVGKNRP